MPGDELIPGARSATRAITIDATPEEVWPWLVQIGFGKAGWYSYDWIDNDFKPSADRIIPEYQDLEVGDKILMMPRMGFVVQSVDDDRSIVSVLEDGSTSWCLGLYPDRRGGTRLVSRWRPKFEMTPAIVLDVGAGRARHVHHGAEDAADDPGQSRNVVRRRSGGGVATARPRVPMKRARALSAVHIRYRRPISLRRSSIRCTRAAHDGDRRTERRPGRGIREPMSAEIHAADRHHQSEDCREHLEIPSLRAGRDQHDHRRDHNRRAGNRVAGRERPTRGLDQ